MVCTLGVQKGGFIRITKSKDLNSFSGKMSLPNKKADPVDESDDPLDALIKRSGCLDQHLATIDCMAEKQDWRKCQDELKLFKICMSKQKSKQN